MNFPSKLFGYLLRLPAQIKGMRFGQNSFIGPGYDWFFVQLKRIFLHDNVVIGKNAWIQTIENGKIIIEEGTNIGRNTVISAFSSIKIGKKCLISYNVSILDHDHNVKSATISPVESGLSEPEPITIGDNCFIGAHSFILKGVQLGKNCVVGANSVVVQSFPDHSIIAGNPARIIKSRKK